MRDHPSGVALSAPAAAPVLSAKLAEFEVQAGGGAEPGDPMHSTNLNPIGDGDLLSLRKRMPSRVAPVMAFAF